MHISDISIFSDRLLSIDRQNATVPKFIKIVRWNGSENFNEGYKMNLSVKGC